MKTLTALNAMQCNDNTNIERMSARGNALPRRHLKSSGGGRGGAGGHKLAEKTFNRFVPLPRTTAKMLLPLLLLVLLLVPVRVLVLVLQPPRQSTHAAA